MNKETNSRNTAMLTGGKANAIMYAWFVWDKTYNGEPTLLRVNNSELVKENKSKGIY